MSYIFVDVDEARRCAGLIKEQAEKFGALLGDAPENSRGKLEDFCRKLTALYDDLSETTETYAAADEKQKNLHLLTNEGGRVNG